jgi:glutamate racemase
MSTEYHPIGVFDSGYGGLTVLREIVKELPQYDYVYLGDNARTPYGNRSYETVYQYTLECVKHLFSMGCRLVILACNTASAKALRSIQQNDLPNINPDYRVLGVIRPSAEVIGNYSKTNHLGILATKGTVNSRSYILEIEKFFPEAHVSQLACPMWVPLVENGEYANEGTDFFVKKYVDQAMAQDKEVDTILLACTHYPLLLDKIKKFTPEGVQVITQGDIVAKSLKEYLARHPEMEAQCSKGGKLEFYTTDSTEDFSRQAAIFFGQPLEAKKVEF